MPLPSLKDSITRLKPFKQCLLKLGYTTPYTFHWEVIQFEHKSEYRSRIVELTVSQDDQDVWVYVAEKVNNLSQRRTLLSAVIPTPEDLEKVLSWLR